MLITYIISVGLKIVHIVIILENVVWLESTPTILVFGLARHRLLLGGVVSTPVAVCATTFPSIVLPVAVVTKSLPKMLVAASSLLETVLIMLMLRWDIEVCSRCIWCWCL